MLIAGERLLPLGGLATMAGAAKGLPVGDIPEQAHIAAVGNDVVYHGGGRQKALGLADAAEGVLAEEGEAGPGPVAAVTPRGGATPQTFLGALTFGAQVTGAKRPAAGPGAGFRRACGHERAF